jgi:oxygen-dependent protoporphyrinogen oxidase
MDEHERVDVAVVGAGISGLAAAAALARTGLAVRVFEKRHTVGGRIVSERCGGFLMEHGPSAIVAPAPAAEALVAATGLAAERIERGERARHRYLVRDARAHSLPLAPLRLFASPFFTLRGRLRLLAEPFIAPEAGDETVADFATRRFGREFLDYLVDPLVGGLHAGDPAALSTVATFPQLKQMERESGSIVRALLRAPLNGSALPRANPGRRQLFSFRHGLATLPHALATALGARLRCATCVERIDPERDGLRLAWTRGATTGVTRARAIVLAQPAYAAARLVAPLHAAAGAALRGIAHPPLAVVFLGYRAAALRHPLDGLGVLMPALERRAVLGAIFSSTLFAGRAPQEHVAVTAFVGGAREPERACAPPRQLIADAHRELDLLFGASEPPVLARVRYWRHGLPQPDLAHANRLATLAACEAQLPGLHFVGNFFAGASTAACIAGAQSTAERIIRSLREAMPASAAPPAASALAGCA